ncbi:MAG: hypothetical protein AAF184_16740 [Pseudomonadota bacterium]
MNAETPPSPRSEVRVVQAVDGGFTLLRNGEPYRVKGAGYSSGEATTGGSLAVLAQSGGNSIRTWGIDQLEQEVDGKPLLDRAHELGLTVAVGFWVQHVRHGFDYGDATRVAEQREQLRAAVLKYRDHPALLLWGLGNEMERVWDGDGDENTLSDERIWTELNHLAGIIKDLDPHHPVMTVVDGTPPAKVQAIQSQYPALDILGINSYAGAVGAGRRLRDAGWDGPYMLTEFGVTGTWEVPVTAWNAPIEPDPSTKASESYTAYTRDRDDNAGHSLGSYVFLWGSKQEATFTWFGMFLPTGEKLPRVDAMAYAWSGRWPANRAPKLRSLVTPVAMKAVKPGSSSYAQVDCIDREGNALSYAWEIRSESNDRRVGGDAEAVPPTIPNAISSGQGTARIEFKAPQSPGAYRLFVTAYDGHGGAVAHNLPFFVSD